MVYTHQFHLSHLIESVQSRASRYIISGYSLLCSVSNLKSSFSYYNRSVHRQFSHLGLFHKFYHHPHTRPECISQAPFLFPPVLIPQQGRHSNLSYRVLFRTFSSPDRQRMELPSRDAAGSSSWTMEHFVAICKTSCCPSTNLKSMYPHVTPTGLWRSSMNK